MARFDEAFERVQKLVREFEANEPYYLSANYQESEVRTDYIDKFWNALGWDVRHKYQTNPREQEVKVEKNPDSSASNRKADYAFYFTPEYRSPIFLVEAKKPSRKLADYDTYFQIVRYGRGAGTPVCILTDFEEFHIIDCRYEPSMTKSFPSAQIHAFTYKDYLDKEKFGYIYWLFSHEAIEEGKLKQFIKGMPKGRGKGSAKLTPDELVPPDEKFLKKLEEYRLTIAKAFKKEDESLTAEELTEATQKVIDRLVFIRFLEDKNIEADYIVDQISAKKGAAWKSFLAWSKELDVKYNGIVFKPHHIDYASFIPPNDDVFLKVCADLSHRESKTLLSYVSVEILGSIYEQFLGKVITATAKRADIEEKPEVRKAGGVYYTPQYIVKYIVANTVKKTLEGKTPQEASKLRFADIACGSGSFLIAVYDAVLHHVEAYYNAHPEEARKAKCIEIDKDVFALSLAQKRQILTDNIYGVDIDNQAVEVAQLSLFLKLLETESGSLVGQITFERTKILPDLSKNILCGNSLVEYDIQDLFPLTQENEHKIKPFDFRSSFKDIMSKGGFDAIVGNPPYVRQESLGDLKNYFQKRYEVFQGTADLYTYFIERGVSLLKDGGKFSYIVANKWMRANYGLPLRKWLKKQCLEEIVDFGDLQVFKGATTYPCIIKIAKDKRHDAFNAVNVKTLEFEDLASYVSSNSFEVDFNSVSDDGWSLNDLKSYNILEKMKGIGKPLGVYLDNEIYYGIKTGLNEAFVIDDETRNRIVEVDKKSTELIVPFLAGREIKRYNEPAPTKYLILIPSGWTKKQKSSIKHAWSVLEEMYPAIASHLKQFEQKASARSDMGDYWWELRPCVYYDVFANPKILLPDISLRGNFMLDKKGGCYSVNTTYVIKSSDVFLLGILNSKLTTFFYSNLSASYSGGYYRFIYQYLVQIPIPTLDLTKATERGQHDKMVSLVEQMLEAKKRLGASRTESDRTQAGRKCEFLDSEIDKLVYELYGLTAEEIGIVEGA